MLTLKGIAACEGIAIASAFVYRQQKLKTTEYISAASHIETQRFQQAVALLTKNITALRNKPDISQEQIDILEMQQEFLSDPAFAGEIETHISQKSIDSVSAIRTVTHELTEEFKEIENEYFAQRINDIQDIAAQLTRILLGIHENPLSLIKTPSIIVAEDLTPSDTANMNMKYVLALCTETGSATSHTAIISRSLAIPAVVGIGKHKITTGQMLILDGTRGTIIVNPNKQTLTEYSKRQSEWYQQRKYTITQAKKPAVTIDNVSLSVFANISNTEEARNATEQGAEGIGLLRTEFLFLENTMLPSEDEQTTVYRKIIECFPNQPIIIRTLDIGGDKPLPALPLPKENNPFLGTRGIRLSLAFPDVFQTQLRAILRAADGFDVQIMFPMITNVADFRQAAHYVEKAKTYLKRKKCHFNAQCKIGVMIEVPSAAVCAAQLASEADFFSIGTNDLSQYTLASDRTNQDVLPFADTFDPAVLNLIERTVSAAHTYKKHAGICGEMAGMPLALPFFMSIGVDEYSMSPSQIPTIKSLIRNTSSKQVKDVSQEVLQLKTAQETRAYLQHYLPEEYREQLS